MFALGIVRHRQTAPLALLALLAVTAGCQQEPAPAAPADEAKTPTVRVVRPEYRVLRRTVEQPGSIQAYEEAPLYAKVAGYARAVNVDIGQEVKAPRPGEEAKPLAEIDAPEMVEELNQKKAMVRQGELEIEQAEKAHATAEANLAASKSLVVEAEAGQKRGRANYERWRSEAQRVAELVRNRVIDAQTRDETVNQFKAAEAARDEADARVVSAEAMARKAKAEVDKAAVDVKTARARLDVHKADVRRVEALVGYSRIWAPFDGIVTRRNVDTGHFVRPPTADAARPLFVVARNDRVRVVVAVPETDAPLVKEGNKVHIRLPSAKGGAVDGTVARTAWALDTGSRTLRVEVDLPNPGGRLRPGTYVTAAIDTDWPRALTLPATAVVKQGDAMVCYRVDNGKAVRTPVQVGHGDGKHVEVLRKQKAGSTTAWEDWTGKEEVVAAPPKELADGQAVVVK